MINEIEKVLYVNVLNMKSIAHIQYLIKWGNMPNVYNTQISNVFKGDDVTKDI